MCIHHLHTDAKFTPHSTWIAWFPVSLYSTIYVGDIYKHTSPPANTPDEQNALDAEATRLGSRALFFSALLSLLLNLALPLFVSESAGTQNGRPAIPNTAQSWFKRACRVPRSMQVHLATLWAVSHIVFAACMFATLSVSFLLAFILSSESFHHSFTQSVWGSTFIITMTGFSWAITQWAPFSLVRLFKKNN